MPLPPGPIAVAGARGFVAARLLPRLETLRVSLVAILRPGRDAQPFLARGVDVRYADLDTGVGVAEAFAGVQTVVHLAGMRQASWLAPAFEQAGVQRAVFLSSTGVHTRLPGASADAKRAGETAVRASRLDWTILRPTIIYGVPGDRTLERLIGWARRCPVMFIPGGGAALQQPVHVDDVVQAIVAALERPATAGRAYDLGGAEALPLRELIALCAQMLGHPALLVPAPLDGVHALIRTARRIGLRVPLRPEQVLRLAEGKAVDIGPAMRDLSFIPCGIEAGLRREIDLLFPPSPVATAPAGTVVESRGS